MGRVVLLKNIKKGCEKFLGFTRFEVGEGSRNSFWHDLWCGGYGSKGSLSDFI
jgi:hypothetical protein